MSTLRAGQGPSLIDSGLNRFGLLQPVLPHCLQRQQRVACSALNFQHVSSTSRPWSRKAGQNGKLGLPRGCFAGGAPLRLVSAREAPQDTSASVVLSASAAEDQIIVLGLSPEALVTATPVPSTPLSSRQGEAFEAFDNNGVLTPLVDAQALLAASPGIDVLATSATARTQPALPELAVFNARPTPPISSSIPLGPVANASASASAYVVAPQAAAAAIASATAMAGPTSGASSDSPASTASATISGSRIDSISSGPQPAATTSHFAEFSQPSSPASPSGQKAAPTGGQGSLWQRLCSAAAGVHWGKLWALALLFVSYVHQATTGFALPAMLPMISNELHLTDLQGALLTTGYSYLYAIALVPIGLLADRVSRPKLLAAGLAVWSALTVTASTCRSFSDLMFARVGFAAAQGAQNPVCFSLIPELFPANKSTALAVYNCAIYVGRALSFAAVLAARHLHDNDQAHLAARGGVRVETRLDHLDRADLHSLAIMHTKGDMAAAAPDHEYNFPLGEYGGELPDAAWRQVLRWIALPGVLIGLAMLFTLGEPRQQPAAAPATPSAVQQQQPHAGSQLASSASAAVAAPSLAADPKHAVDRSAATAGATTIPHDAGNSAAASAGGLAALLRSPSFMSVTLAAALNDVASYALIAWQSTFYERVYGLSSAAYAPVLALLLPVGGIIGGVGGGFLADRLSRSGRRWMVTAGATFASAPCLAASCLAATPEASYAALLVGFALSEAWRAPSAVMARGIAPASMGSTASALYLCVRNLVGGMGPLAVAGLAAGPLGLQGAMMAVVPTTLAASGLLFAKAEKLFEAEMAAKAKMQAANA